MTLVALSQIVVIALFVTFCVHLHCGPGAFRKVVRFWLDAPFRRPLRDCLIVFFAVLALDGFETRRDDALTRWLGYDCTSWIHRLEGDFVAVTQDLLGFRWLSPLLAFAYVIGFIGLLVGLAHAYDRAHDRRRLVMVTFAYAVNYLAVLPFYVLFPVKEPWAHPGSGVLPLTDLHVGPWVMELIRPMSGIDNCFPSYHVSLTTSLILVARDGDRGPLARFTTAMGLLVIVSTVILGFHWVIDALAGVLFGVAIHVVGKRFASRFRQSP